MSESKTYSDGTTPSICIIGAGFGGLTTAIQLKRKLNLKTFTIFEKRADVGGVWLANTYPGAKCDVVAHVYSWSFEPFNEWRGSYAMQAEILKYMQNTAKKYDLYSHLKCNTSVISCIWNEELGKWNVTSINNLTGITTVAAFDFVVVAVSLCWNPNIPNMFDGFTGDMMHTAQWNHSVDLKDKIVGVIGSGLSAVQLIPNIVSQVKELHSFQRTPVWIFPKFLNFKLGTVSRWLQRNFTATGKLFRWICVVGGDNLASGIKERSLLQKAMRRFGKFYMKWQSSGKEGLFQEIQPSPDTAPGCRNFAVNCRFIPSLCSPNVKVYRQGIKNVCEKTLTLEDGTTVDLDVLILATGFKVQDYFGPLQILGNNGEDIGKIWAEQRLNTYYGICTESAKNLFFTFGPHTVLLHHSALVTIECQATYVVRVLRHMMKNDLRQCQVNAEVTQEFMTLRASGIAKTVFVSERCRQSYNGQNGFETLVFPFNASRYSKVLKKVNPLLFSFN